MATTAIWKIKTGLKNSINYITNPEKTANKDYGKNNNHWLHNDEFNYKNEKCEYISGINCLVETAYEEMLLTKESYGQENGIIAFHCYQSFKEGEVTPDKAHEIGVKLAEELFGNRFEVVVATHQNTNHIHNHFIINSVSFKDGKKYDNNKTNYSMMREVSDSLCEEYGLSTLDGWRHDKYTKYKYFYQQKVQNDDYYKFVKEDIDTAISETIILKQFLDRLKQYGYEYYYLNGKLTVWKDGYDKIRVERAFGEDYSIDKIKDKLSNSRYKQYKYIPASEIYKSFLTKNEARKGIYGLYLFYCYLLKVFPTEQPKQRLSYSIRKDIKEMDKISNQIIFMTENKIETYEELMKYKSSIVSELYNLKCDKANLRRRYNRAEDEDIKVNLHNEIVDIDVRIKELYKYKKYCDDIEKRSTTIETNIAEFNNESPINKSKERLQTI